MRTLAKSRNLSNVRAMCQQAKHEANVAQCNAAAAAGLEDSIKYLSHKLDCLKQRIGAFATITPARRDALLCEWGFGKPLAIANVVELSDDDLIDLAAGAAGEIERRAMQVELSPAARRSVEQSIIDNEIEDRFDSSFFSNAY